VLVGARIKWLAKLMEAPRRYWIFYVDCLDLGI